MPDTVGRTRTRVSVTTAFSPGTVVRYALLSSEKSDATKTRGGEVVGPLVDSKSGVRNAERYTASESHWIDLR
jgi:hypothetical protein